MCMNRCTALRGNASNLAGTWRGRTDQLVLPVFGLAEGPFWPRPVEVKGAEPEMKATATPTMVLPTPVAETPRTFNRLSHYWPGDILALEGIIAVAADRNNLEPNLVAALVKKESWFDPAKFPQGLNRCPEGPCSGSCTSSEGALGPAQVMPYHFSSIEDGRDAVTNIRRGAEILRGYIDKKGGIRKGLAAYYCGPNNETYWQECWAYADSILDWYRESKAKEG